MPKRPAVEALPKPVRAWLDTALVDGNFSGYEALSMALKAKGFSIGKSALHRHGEKIEKRLAAIKASTEAAKLIVANSEDAEDARSEALISLVQNELFDALVNLQDANEEDDPKDRVALLAKAGKGIGEITRASIGQKKFATKVRADAKAEAAKAVDVVAATKGSGLSKETAETIKRAILGVTG